MLNRLSKEKSPYLLQHQDNPIDWYPWGEEAFSRAKKEDKPIFLSIGYATCHWCHVMEGDSFVKQEVADILNRNFVSIKVDREERPDVDAVYMRAVQALTGHGGWPLSAMLTPDLTPFWGGTFFPREQFIKVLQQIDTMWRSEERTRLLNSGDQLLKYLEEVSKQSPEKGKIDETAYAKALFSTVSTDFDPSYGGFGGAPKFPSAMLLMSLMRLYRRTGKAALLTMVETTLNGMMRGGIWDHLGGGFHRYATDRKWLVPHFEKMLYDNALLSLAYTEAFQITRNESYARIVEKTLSYVQNEMEAPNGGFFSAEDADSEKTEGKFYVWQDDELQKILAPEELAWLRANYNTEKDGNFKISKQVEALEHAAGMKSVPQANILYVKMDQTPPNEAEPRYQEIVAKLRAVREKRVRPLKDDKILASWNGLMIAAFAKAYQCFGNQSYLESARKAANFLLTNLWRENKLYRRYREGDVRFAGGLDDYAGIVFGLTELYQADFNDKWLTNALEIQRRQNELFWDDIEGGFFDTDGSDSSVIMRHKDYSDNAMPSGNSLAAYNLLRLSDLTANLDHRKKSEMILSINIGQMNEYPRAFPVLGWALDYYTDASKQILVAGPDNESATASARSLQSKSFIPNKVVALGPSESLSWTDGKTAKDGRLTYYVCEFGQCLTPTTDFDEAWNQASAYKAITI